MSRLVKELKNAENLGILLKMQARSRTWAHSPLSVLTTAQYTLQCPILHVFLGVVTQLTLTPEYSTPNVQTSAWRTGRGSLESTSELHVAYFIPAGCKYPLPFCPSVCGPNQWLVITWIRTVLGFLLVFFAKTCNIYLCVSGLKSRKCPPEVRKHFFHEKRQFHSSWHLPYNHILKSKGLQKWTTTTKFYPCLLCIVLTYPWTGCRLQR